LRVASATNYSAPRGVLLWLVGGPGEAGSRMANEIARQFSAAVLRDYRLVLISGRGTGENALNCPELQQAMGSSDLVVPPADAVTSCARALGDNRRFFTTADTVGDLDMLRSALGAQRWSIDSASYGTYVAERYAITHPDRVNRLVLDGVVASDGSDLFLNTAVMRQVGVVLRLACGQLNCGTDPAADLARIVALRHDGPELLDVISGSTGGAPQLSDLLPALHQAALGRPAALDSLLTAAARRRQATAQDLSQGLHAATSCEDQPAPWGDASTPTPARTTALNTVVAAIPSQQLWPFDAATATGTGSVITCLLWPPTPVPAATVHARHSPLPPVPTLILAGQEDLETPLAWAEHEATLAPRGQLVIIPRAGHVVQDTTNPAAGRDVVTHFLTTPSTT
jgi:pimeloyl-ACP methyl ester carboxylesterase